MDTIETNIQLLVGSLRQSPEYIEYKRCRENLDNRPELWPRVEKFCSENYRMRSMDEEQLAVAMDEVARDSNEIRKIPEVNAYLQAELNLCRLVQNVSLDIIGSLDIHIPPL